MTIFPYIETIDDVLPHIEGVEEFYVNDKGDYIAIIYHLQTNDTFKHQNEKTYKTRLECRGLLFDSKTKAIIRRPLHKFFNYGEREGLFYDLGERHVIMDKLDGSMIAPFTTSSWGGFRLGSKAGITNTSMNAEAFIADKKNYIDFIDAVLKSERTPIFEWCSKRDKIVLDYEDQLVLLGIRDLRSGEYYKYSYLKSLGRIWDIPVVNTTTADSMDMDNLNSHIKTMRDTEGIVVGFDNGHRLKVKTDWYLRIHRVLDGLRHDRNVLDLILNEKIDDIYAKLDGEIAHNIREYEDNFWDVFAKKIICLSESCSEAVQQYGNDCKSIALYYVPYLNHKLDKKFIFDYARGNHDIKSNMIKMLKDHLSTNTRYEKIWEWLNASRV